ncbi:MAG: hypothetical protein DRH08_12265 [Deltaproteobacteria bacterium]|nr:MAG: hypothetical protein DRH08_12265 [Deltaproteobacteria bacterium]
MQGGSAAVRSEDSPNSNTTVGYFEEDGVSFPSWILDGVIWYDDIPYTPYAATDGDKAYVDGTVATVAAVTSTSDYYIERRWYTLPDDFGGMVSDSFSYRRDDNCCYPDIEIVGEAEVRRMSSQDRGGTYPRVASITPKEPENGLPVIWDPQDKDDQTNSLDLEVPAAASTRWRVNFDVYPTAALNLEYRYHAVPPALGSTTNFYHYGGAEHSSTIIASVIDQAFQKIHSSYEKHDAFMARLRQSVMHDRRNYAASYVGKGVGSYGAGGHNDLDHFRRNTSTDNITLGF